MCIAYTIKSYNGNSICCIPSLNVLMKISCNGIGNINDTKFELYRYFCAHQINEILLKIGRPRKK